MDYVTEPDRKIHALRFRSHIQRVTVYIRHRLIPGASLVLGALHTHTKHNGRAPLGYSRTISSSYAAHGSAASHLLGVRNAYRLLSTQ